MAAPDVAADDLEELKHLLAQSKRPRVQSLLSSEIEALEKAHSSAALVQVAKVAPLQSLQKGAVVPEVQYTSLSTFSWDQDNDKVKVYFPLDGALQEKVSFNFDRSSFVVKVHDVAGKNYRCGIPKLNKAIDPDKSSVTVKPKRIIVTLKKHDNGNWSDLHYKEEKFKPNLGKEKDPMSGIMDLMKNMYDEGDEDMKKTIAKAWSEARSGKKSDPLSSGLNDF
ncbi:hypothetical protein O6H91_05G017400 [Diphasiastrum complanatum]|uniref:Uncharacterized protein n=2 Tax=Diphasiastrum complanatum TaxID=34168 RepID=A0ACC2DKY4_DIPCM|nr:hypothetical protein O6H91_05G017100 [Diphasiastrum complanatum]KAJ7554958.1 hypothetical protein O6H91_05G017400 [Diphasiastrum complanatum]